MLKKERKATAKEGCDEQGVKCCYLGGKEGEEEKEGAERGREKRAEREEEGRRRGNKEEKRRRRKGKGGREESKEWAFLSEEASIVLPSCFVKRPEILNENKEERRSPLCWDRLSSRF